MLEPQLQPAKGAPMRSAERADDIVAMAARRTQAKRPNMPKMVRPIGKQIVTLYFHVDISALVERGKTSVKSRACPLWMAPALQGVNWRGGIGRGLTAFLYQRHRETIALWSALDIWTVLNESFRRCPLPTQNVVRRRNHCSPKSSNHFCNKICHKRPSRTC